MKRRSLFGLGILLVVAIVLLIVAEDRIGNHQGSRHAVNPRLVSADNEFGFRLFSKLAAGASGKNVFISPTSIALALAMTYNGAAGVTKEEMAKALGLGGMSVDELNKGSSGLMSALTASDRGIELHIANSLWARPDESFKPEFLERVKTAYDAELGAFSPGRVNAWVSRKTRGKITRIVGPSDAQSVLALVNAIYFKGIWTVRFDKSKTHDGRFFLADGGTKMVPMMHQSGKHQVLMRPGFQAVRLPYGRGRLAMYIFVPHRGLTLGDFLKELNLKNWSEWMSDFERQRCDVNIPRFKVTYEVKLNDTLADLGMKQAFQQDADFSGMSRPPLWIDTVRHKTFLEVNEEGTEAAGATVVTMARAMKRSFTADHPFFCAIADGKTGAILFMGLVYDPSQD